MSRPQVKARRWDWMDMQIKTPGIGLFDARPEYDRLIRGHLTIDEARELADRLHDLCDQLEPTPEENTP